MNSIAVRVGSVLLVLALAGTLLGQELRVRRTIGLDDNDLVLLRPIDIVWSADGLAFVLNAADNSIAVFSPEWNHLRTFGQRGEGPGEIGTPSCLVVVDDELWVKQMSRVEVFDLRGHYLRTIPIDNRISSLKRVGDVFVGTSTAAEGSGVWLDHQGAIVAHFGPTVGPVRGIEDLARASAWLALPSGPSESSLLNRFDGAAWMPTSGPISLGLGTGELTSSFSYRNVISDACKDPDGGYLVLHYAKDSEVGFLRFYGESWEPGVTLTLPDGVEPGIIRVSPAGEFCLLEESSSILYVCERPHIARN